MSASVLPYRSKAEMPDESWLTVRRMQAYYVLGAVNPALMAAGAEFATSRTTEVERIEAALHASEQLSDEVDAKGRDYVIAVMRQDAQAQHQRVAQGGW